MEKHNPAKAGNVEAIWAKRGRSVWQALERKYPGTTSEFVVGLNMEDPAPVRAVHHIRGTVAS